MVPRIAARAVRRTRRYTLDNQAMESIENTRNDAPASPEPSPTLPVQVQRPATPDDDAQQEQDERLLNAFERLRARSRSRSPVRGATPEEPSLPEETSLEQDETDEQIVVNPIAAKVEPIKPSPELSFKVPPVESLETLLKEVAEITEKLMQSSPVSLESSWKRSILAEMQNVVGALRRNPRYFRYTQLLVARHANKGQMVSFCSNGKTT